jgi:hypothetical protein
MRADEDGVPRPEPSELATEDIPPAPVPQPYELWLGAPYALVDKGRYTIGWQSWPEKKGGPGFVTLRRGAMSTLKIVNRYALTDEGWAEAWREITALDPATAERARHQLARRTDADAVALERKRLQASSLGYLGRVIYLGGYVPGAELTAGQPYDVWFTPDQIAVRAPGELKALAEVPYPEVATVDIGGPGLTKSGGGFIGGGYGVAGAAEGMAIAAVLNALTTRVKIKTVIRIEAAQAELFFLHTLVEPEALRIELSRALGAIRQAKPATIEPGGGGDRSYRSAAERLATVTRLHDEGVLTDQEYQAKRAEIIAQL